MLDKTVPYAGLFMRREAGVQTAAYPLPDGYRFAFYNDGDEISWARLEASVLEFDNEFAALMHFKENFAQDVDELRRRCLFIENSDGMKIATSTAWWRHIGDERRPWLHWVAVDPQYQGLGLGKAIVSRVVDLMIELEGDADFFLGTQTWSYKAINIYMAHGFQPTQEKKLYTDRRNNYKKAMRILRKLTKRRESDDRRSTISMLTPRSDC